MSPSDEKQMKSALATISERTTFDLKTVIAIVMSTVFLMTTYMGLYNRQTEILTKLDYIEKEFRKGSRWTRENQEDFIREVQLLNPDLTLPDPRDFVEQE